MLWLNVSGTRKECVTGVPTPGAWLTVVFNALSELNSRNSDSSQYVADPRRKIIHTRKRWRGFRSTRLKTKQTK
jgi:hypothetical protein